ncbi:flagellar biosynthetic protein FlhB [Paenibacillus baekrokdamisoli]|uniref:Flagellar biosynthetic protein FlhB n=1 Tax=Paenibacillus baekrokdamisoli TaxID=1712516 RepID=A0A3G9JAC8_9BACL|nr:flagellar biosynthesis protein FlhB [Paenibacillus baekrokdamisoli]MBB3069788.1 flagellar biosynthetic protein FlhB [Paenibacillus baekrokdamisoli]BBH20858.1 flagellar biosynthetic protein FlhB [Paenibacillus baekrokdamisoli]
MSSYRWTLDLQMFSQEKTERATPKKREESRKKGQVAKSSELPAAFIMLVSFFSFMMLGGYYKERLIRMFGLIFEQKLMMELTKENVLTLFSSLMMQIFMLLAPLFIITVVIGLVGNYVQIGFLFTGEPLKMNLNKINPLKGFKQIFSMRSIVEFFKNITKLIVIAVIVYLTVWNQRAHIMQLGSVPISYMFSFIGSITVKLGLEIGSILAVLAVGDYIYQRFEHEKSLRMSKQDIKDEYKKSEGDPLIKGKIRERQRRMALQRMMQEVPKADVIITNPTHFAIALQYDGTKMEAPTVIAKGMDFVALRIREVAKENGVITMENKPLARALYERAEIGDVVPADLFQAVAEVLAYVYKIKGRVK